MSTDSARQGAAASRRSLEPWRERFFASADGLRLHYRDYAARQGGSARLPVLCLAGLTRNSRDFERLAPHLQRDRRVLAADLRGRGRSARDPNWRNYQPSVYLADLRALLDDAHAARVVIVGTSLGGLLAMMLAALEPARVARIVLNDIGPEIDPAGRTRITTYVGRSPPVAKWDPASRSRARTTASRFWPERHQLVVLARRVTRSRRGSDPRWNREPGKRAAPRPILKKLAPFPASIRSIFPFKKFLNYVGETPMLGANLNSSLKIQLGFSLLIMRIFVNYFH